MIMKKAVLIVLGILLILTGRADRPAETEPAVTTQTKTEWAPEIAGA